MYKNAKIVLITSGPTREFIDPIRYISNSSSGKLGYYLAKNFLNLGYKVILITGPTCVNIKKNKNFLVYHVTTTREMFSLVKKFFNISKIFISVAAVCDFRPKFFRKQKIKKKKFLNLKLVPTVDILKYFSKFKKNSQILIGFALETDRTQAFKNAFKKLKEKKLDFIILNFVDSLNSNYISPTIIYKSRQILRYKKLTKKLFAKKLSFLIKKYEQSKD